MKRRNVRFLLAGAALAAVVAASAVSPALAYFTAYTSAAGGVRIAVGPPDTELREEPEGLRKTISVANTGDSPCFVRVRLFYPADVVGLGSVSLGEGWGEPGADGFWHYAPVLEPGETTTDLDVTFEALDGSGNNFHVVVAEEYTPALYDAGTGGYYADWDLAAAADPDAGEEGEEAEAE